MIEKKGTKALIADDDRDIVEIVKMSFEKANIPAIGVFSGSEAIEKVNEGDVGVVPHDASHQLPASDRPSPQTHPSMHGSCVR